MKYLLLFLSLTCNAFALSGEEIKGLLAREHDSTNLLEELKVFPQGRSYKTVVKALYPERKEVLKPIIYKGKVVDGRYMVSEFNFDAGSVKINYVYVITYSKKLNRYKMWLRYTLDDGEDSIVIVDEFDGIYMKSVGVLSWMLVPNVHRPGQNSSILIKFNENSYESISCNYLKGKMISMLSTVTSTIQPK